MNDPLTEFYIVNLKYAVDALQRIRDLDSEHWASGMSQSIAEIGLKDLNAGLLAKVQDALDQDCIKEEV